jgi:hypothetical protein
MDKFEKLETTATFPDDYHGSRSYGCVGQHSLIIPVHWSVGDLYMNCVLTMLSINRWILSRPWIRVIVTVIAIVLVFFRDGLPKKNE